MRGGRPPRGDHGAAVATADDRPVVTPLLTLAAVGIALVAVAGAAVVRRGRPVGGAELAVAGVAVAGGAALGLVGVLVVTAALSSFALAHLLYLVLVVTVPMVGVGLAALAWRRGAARWVWGVVVAALVPAALGVYATHVEPYRLTVDRAVLAVDPARAGDDQVRIAVLADLQTSGVGDHERRAVDEVMASHPDVILLPGDLFQGDMSDGDRDDMRRLLGRLQAPHGVWFVRGDSDGGDGGTADRILDGLDIEVLVDEVVHVPVGDRTLRLGGTSLQFGLDGPQRVRDELETTPDDGPITLLVGHRPDNVLLLPSGSRVDLTVAGHTHGGQIVVPGIGPLVTLSEVPRDVARGGLHTVAGNPIYVSPGVGMERGHAPQVRFLSRPTVAVLTLRDA